MPMSPLWLLLLFSWLASLSSGALAGYGSALVVLVGVVGETVTELTDWIRPESRKKKIAKVSALVLIVGLTGDLLGIRETQLEVADLTKGISDAKTSAEGAASAAARAKASADDAHTVAGNALDKSTEANGLAGKAQRNAREVERQAAELGGQLLGAKTQLNAVDAKRAELEKSLIDLAVCNAPRVVSHWSFSGAQGNKSYIDPLRPWAGQKVFIEAVPNDAEARRAAFQIAQTLSDAKWDSQKPITFMDGLADGVSIQPSVTGTSVSGQWRASDAANALVEFLHLYNWEATRDFPMDTNNLLIRDERILPAEAIRIQIGLYPAAVYVRPPGQHDLDSLLEGMKRDLEKGRVETERKMLESLAKLPPENRRRAEQAYRQSEAKMKSERSNGPCPVLSPFPF